MKGVTQMIDRELLRNIGFVRTDDRLVDGVKVEVWVLDKSPWLIFVGYGDYQGAPYLCGDTASVADLITYVMADAETAIAEMQAGDNW